MRLQGCRVWRPCPSLSPPFVGENVPRTVKDVLGVAVGLSSALGFGLAALLYYQTGQPQLVNLVDVSPSGLRRKRRAQVDAVVLHQTGFSWGNDPLKYKDVKAHFVVLPDGKVAQLHPVNARLSASHGFNSRSIAVEFVGNFQSSRGRWWNPETYGRHTLSKAQIQSGRWLLRRFRRMGLAHVYAHRQSFYERSNDPGPEVWAAVGQWGLEQLEMSDGGEGYFIGTGQPIHRTWRTYGRSTSEHEHV